ncbi:MAG: hypothetical protein Q7T33_00125 [Dehalococcoidia bacterium]|nr:hypothetical protein [Dehalococcoidia bacterium]
MPTDYAGAGGLPRTGGGDEDGGSMALLPLLLAGGAVVLGGIGAAARLGRR